MPDFTGDPRPAHPSTRPPPQPYRAPEGSQEARPQATLALAARLPPGSRQAAQTQSSHLPTRPSSSLDSLATTPASAPSLRWPLQPQAASKTPGFQRAPRSQTGLTSEPQLLGLLQAAPRTRGFRRTPIPAAAPPRAGLWLLLLWPQLLVNPGSQPTSAPVGSHNRLPPQHQLPGQAISRPAGLPQPWVVPEASKPHPCKPRLWPGTTRKAECWDPGFQPTSAPGPSKVPGLGCSPRM